MGHARQDERVVVLHRAVGVPMAVEGDREITGFDRIVVMVRKVERHEAGRQARRDQRREREQDGDAAARTGHPGILCPDPPRGQIRASPRSTRWPGLARAACRISMSRQASWAEHSTGRSCSRSST